MTSITTGTPGLFVLLPRDRSGHTADLGRELAPALGLPLLARTTLHDALAGVLNLSDSEQSSRFGRACSSALVALAAQSGGGVLDGIGADDEALAGLDGQVVEVVVLPEGEGENAPTGDHRWPTVAVDASAPVDVDPLADEVVAAASRAAGRPEAPTQWVVWRIDPQGGRVEVTRRDSEAVARSVAAAMGATAGGQSFEVTPAG